MKKTIYYILIGVFSAVFLFCAFKVGDYFIKSYQHQQYYNQMASMKESIENQGTAGNLPSGSLPAGSDATEGSGTQNPDRGPMLEYMAPLYQMNPHVVGWIEIDGTRVNYPVMQTPNEPSWRDYYLYRNFERQDDIRGSIYVREACDVFEPSDNLVIYGHNMQDHSMFGELFDYKYYSYFQDHPYVYFDTLYERHTYEIFAVFRTSGTLGEGFAYHLFSDAKNQGEFDDFVAECKRLSFYDTGITPTYGDKLITLSTCDFHIENGRLVVVARRID